MPGLIGLPGDSWKLPEDTTEVCEDCADIDSKIVPAVYKFQGETDSFGAEYCYLCEKHHAAAKASDFEGICDSCHKAGILRPLRDPGEGMAGPVYRYCNPCYIRIRAEDQEAEWF
jgi:hypothetical protein